MKRHIVTILGAAIVLAVVYIAVLRPQSANDGSPVSGPPSAGLPSEGQPGDGGLVGGAPGGEAGSAPSVQGTEVSPLIGGDGEIKPASSYYTGVEAALEAIKKASSTHDDLVLEQFRAMGPDCSWCGKFYQDLQKMLASGELGADESLYYAEILAISGVVENVKFVADLAEKSPPESDQFEAYIQAFELSVGTPEVIQYYSYVAQSQNERMREAAVAALTNQSSLTAAKALYDHIVSRGDPTGYDEIGLGLGEFVPDEEVFPYLQELINKRDKYSNLAVKSLLNAGLPGLKLVFDNLGSSGNVENDRALLKDAVDHVLVDEETETYVREKLKESQAPLVQEFGKEIIDRLSGEGEEVGDVPEIGQENPEL